MIATEVDEFRWFPTNLGRLKQKKTKIFIF